MCDEYKKSNAIVNRRGARQRGFTLVELLVVLVIMAILSSLVVAAFNSIGDSQSFASQSNDFQQLLDDARAYAMANNTYTFIGIEEVDASQPTSAVPQNLVTATKGGRIAAAVVTTRDGTSALGTDNSNVVAISKLKVFPNMHLQANYYMGPGRKSSTNVTATSPSPMANRALLTGKTYTLGNNATQAASVLNSEYFTWPLTGTAQYTFNRLIQFSPDGSASMVRTPGSSQLTYSPTWLEIDLEQMHGAVLSSVPTYTSLNKASAGHQVVAIQIDGITGNTQLYQQ